eukprot:TRINITY_DN51402_c0_g1_i1.p1 TRINITY_DN51402_c0_g1~~TRINITY_DN51402_c0_g1_i1.p1  ORF type:complete len:550 (+),score=95.55 TRINITY_DN51402_c0_g1_i1:36-1652(+)
MDLSSSSHDVTPAPAHESTTPVVALQGEQVMTYEVNVKCIDGSTTRLEAKSDLTGAQMKELIAKKLDVPADQQRLIFRGRAINDEDVMGSHITESGQTLHMVQRPDAALGNSATGSAVPVPSSTGPTVGQTTMGPQVIQFSTTLPGNFMQGDLARMLSDIILPPFPIPQEANPANPGTGSMERAARGLQASQDAPSSGAFPGSASPSGLPWRDLRRLHTYLSRVLGRSSQYRPALPPRQVPDIQSGDLLAFLEVLHAATSQLGVAISDMQTLLRDGNGPTSRQRLQFTMVLASSGRVMRALSSAMAPDSVLPTSDTAPEPGTEPAIPADFFPNIAAAREDGYLPAASSPPEPASEAGPEDEEDGAVEVAETGEACHSSSAVEPQASSSSEQLHSSQTLDGLIPLLSGTTEAALADMPPSVRSCWEQWTNTEKFSRVIEQAVQPPFSRAYLSGDSTGSHHTPVLPPPEEFLPLRWVRAGGRVQGLREIPEPPDHLSRAYLSAFLRDMGRSVGSDSTYRTVPEVRERYPNLTRITDFVNK